MLLRNHKVSTATGAVGAAIIASHLVLGPAVVPVGAVLIGLTLAGTAVVRLMIVRRRDERAARRQ